MPPALQPDAQPDDIIPRATSRWPRLVLAAAIALTAGIAGSFAFAKYRPNLNKLPPKSPNPPPVAAKVKPQTVKRVAGLVFNFSQDPDHYSYETTEDARRVLWTDANSADAYFQEVSNHRVGLAGDTYGVYSLNFNPHNSCDYQGWAKAAEAAAAKDGFKRENYDYYAYIFTPAAACPWGGIAASIGSQQIWVNGGQPLPSVVIHELGHAFGINHAGSIACFDQNGHATGRFDFRIGNQCEIDQYGDPLDVMGHAGGTTHVSGYHKLSLGWLDPKDLQTVTATGEYSIGPMETPSDSRPVVLRIPISRQVTNTATKTYYYYLEYRQTYGQFDSFSDQDTAVTGLSIREAPDYTSEHSKYEEADTYLINTHPDSGLVGSSPLGLNQSYIDHASGISIKLTAISSQAAKIRVELTPPQPVGGKG